MVDFFAWYAIYMYTCTVLVVMNVHKLLVYRCIFS